MATKKAKPQPKLDATIKMMENRKSISDTVPEFIKPWADFKKVARDGMLVTIKKRILIQNEGRYGLVEISGKIHEASTNTCYIVDENGEKLAAPWWSIHDWEIHVEEVEI
jgi:hypothetical protein